MNKFDELLRKGATKLNAEEKAAEQLLAKRVKTLKAFAKDIYNFIEHVNRTYERYNYEEGSYMSGRWRMTDIFEFDMGYDVGNKFSTKEANKWAKIEIKSPKLKERVWLECDENFNIIARVGYFDVKHFDTASELIDYLSYLIAKDGLKKVRK
jgi:hypothetical protein